MQEIRAYTLKELEEIEGHHKITIKNSFRYIPIAIYSPTIQKRYEQGKQKTDHTTKYIRLEDIQKALKNKVEFNFITK